VLDAIAVVGVQLAVFPLDDDLHLDAPAGRQEDGSHLVLEADDVGGLIEVEMTLCEHQAPIFM
jgi:hypothetical protein